MKLSAGVLTTLLVFTAGSVAHAADTAASPEQGAKSPLAPLASFVGGVWSGALPPGPNGATPHIEMRFSWAENKQVLRFDAAFVSGSNRRPYTSGIYVWDPEAQKLRLVYADAEGSLTDGTVTLENEVLVHELTIKQAHAAPEQIRARLTKSGTDVFTNEIFGQKDGTWTKLVEVRYERAR